MPADRHARRFLPIVGHWTPNVLVDQNGCAIAMYQLAGMAAELAGARAVFAAPLQDNQLFRNVSDPRLEWWDHFVRQDRQRMAALPDVPNWFGARFDAAYRATQGDGTLFRNDLFVTVVLRPEDGLRSGLRALLGGGGREHPQLDRLLLDDFEGVLQKLDAALVRYGARRLGLRERGAVVFCEMAAALALVAHRPVRPVGRAAGPAPSYPSRTTPPAPRR